MNDFNTQQAQENNLQQLLDIKSARLFSRRWLWLSGALLVIAAAALLSFRSGDKAAAPRYATEPACRKQTIHEHFGFHDVEDGCGACDVCIDAAAWQDEHLPPARPWPPAGTRSAAPESACRSSTSRPPRTLRLAAISPALAEPAGAR